MARSPATGLTKQDAPAAAVPPATSCLATPSTVYGDEPVKFEISAAGPPGALVRAEVKDELGRSVHQAELPVPGQLSLPAVPSGDFVLMLGSSVGCRVTVNRELSRSNSAPR